MSDDTPTQRFDAPAGTPVKQPRKRNPVLVAAIIVGAILVVAIIVLVVVLVGRGGASQNAALTLPTTSAAASSTATAPASAPVATPTTTPSASHTTAAPPPVQSTDATFTTFAPDLSKYSCSSGPYYSGPTPILKVKWATVRAVSAWIVQGTSDAAESGFMQIPLSGDQSNFSSPLDLSCDPPSSTFTITLVGTNGKHVSKSWTVINANPTG
jgi:hypothetical protein